VQKNTDIGKDLTEYVKYIRSIMYTLHIFVPQANCVFTIFSTM